MYRAIFFLDQWWELDLSDDEGVSLIIAAQGIPPKRYERDSIGEWLGRWDQYIIFWVRGE